MENYENIKLSYKSLIIVSCVTGFIGDDSLQVLSKIMGGPNGWGVIPYFKQHGSIEELFIKGGIIMFFYVIYLDFLK
jgi:small neutral amino acid transporter SnatA (MarC family)